MSIVLYIKYTLLAMVPVAFYAMWYASFAYDGFRFFHLRDILPSGELPGTPGVRWKEQYTGVYLIDQAIIAAAQFYWTEVSGESLPMTLHFLTTLGGLGASLALLFLEMCRTRPYPQCFQR